VLSASKFIILIDKCASFRIRSVLSDGNETRIPECLEGRYKCEQWQWRYCWEETIRITCCTCSTIPFMRNSFIVIYILPYRLKHNRFLGNSAKRRSSKNISVILSSTSCQRFLFIGKISNKNHGLLNFLY
jgi:hypothetical protein